MQSECQTECKQEWTTIELLQHKISTLEASLSSLAQLDASMLDDKLACLYTGFPTVNSFTDFVNYLEPKVRNSKRTKEFDVQGKQGSVRFKLSEGTYNRLFTSWISFLSKELRLFFPFPSRAQVDKWMP